MPAAIHQVSNRSSYGPMKGTIDDPVTFTIRCNCGWGLRGQASEEAADAAHLAHVAGVMARPTRPSPNTQSADILAMLESADDLTVCGDAFLRAYMPRYAARILDLRHAGWTINRVTCPHDYHDHSRALATYQLVTG